MFSQSLSNGNHPPCSQLHVVFLLSMTPCGTGYPFGQPGLAVLAVPPPSSWCTPSFLGGRAAREAEQPLALCKHCSASTKMSANQCYQQYCHHKSKTQHHRSYRGKKFTLSNQKQDTGSKIAKHSTLIVISYKSCRMAFAQLLTLIYSHELSSTPASSSGNELGLKNGL